MMKTRTWDGSGLEIKRAGQSVFAVKHRRHRTRRFPDPWTLVEDERLGEDYLEICEVGISSPIRTIPFFWYTKGQDMDLTYDVWFARNQLSLDADEVRLSAYAFGADNSLGQEIVQNGYLKARLATSLNFEPLNSGTFLNLGPMPANSRRVINLRLNIPAPALSKGLVIIGLRLQALRSAFYGSLLYNSFFYGNQEKINLDTLTAMIHLFVKT